MFISELTLFHGPKLVVRTLQAFSFTHRNSTLCYPPTSYHTHPKSPSSNSHISSPDARPMSHHAWILVHKWRYKMILNSRSATCEMKRFILWGCNIHRPQAVAGFLSCEQFENPTACRSVAANWVHRQQKKSKPANPLCWSPKCCFISTGFA